MNTSIDCEARGAVLMRTHQPYCRICAGGSPARLRFGDYLIHSDRRPKRRAVLAGAASAVLPLDQRQAARSCSSSLLASKLVEVN